MIRKLVFFVILFLLSGCATGPGDVPRSEKTSAPPDFMNKTIDPPVERNLVGIAGFQNRSTYSADKLWDTSGQLVTNHLMDMMYFRVVEWEKMKRLFDWRDLSTMNIIDSPEKRSKMRKILLCELFLTGSVTYFDVNEQSKVSALSKSKTIETTIRVDLSLQDAVTGEYVSAGKGAWTESQTFSKGKLGTWDPGAADKALDYALRKALLQLTERYHRLAPK